MRRLMLSDEPALDTPQAKRQQTLVTLLTQGQKQP